MLCAYVALMYSEGLNDTDGKGKNLSKVPTILREIFLSLTEKYILCLIQDNHSPALLTPTFS